MQTAKTRIQAVEGEAETTDRLVRVRVNASGALLGVTLGHGTERLSRNQLGEMITRTAQQATRRAAELVATELDELDAAHQSTARHRRIHQPHHRLDPSTDSESHTWQRNRAALTHDRAWAQYIGAHA
ncbi:YbaB/EbfC family nucleoid-associated protein [Nocardia amikacinitolerans]|nr:YbaB/EbfC family nucleoid-associated protein [Nocardia amikacinitolerans]